ncbi:hypothetical protein C2857_003705 [Epichloe festucae Fl1]|uniref:Meiotically up-regulated 65 protein n=1 Tax=Epichloe festucae (strain Fl1) TaxID=877507 RepID=A0A7S9KUT5_EPIFF|nr:hypothetical protein C2857_003705 [Epichloe festucae Fl1]
MVKVRSSRRVAGLKPSDYDHEIGLVNHDGAEDDSTSTAESAAQARRGSTASRLVSLVEDSEQDEGQQASISHNRQRDSHVLHGQNISPHPAASEQGRASLETGASLPHPAMQPSIEVQAATPGVFGGPTRSIIPKRPQQTRETAIDIMYENERGGFICGAALFSSKALGGLDPPAWTNAYHKPSPTNIYTAVVPDPSWEWVWPEWRVNYQDGVDEGGWEYSFAFAKAFSWHPAKWWNSFVRRRAWIRKRAKRQNLDTDSSGNLLNSDYFTVRPASHISKRRSTGSIASSRVPSKSSMKHSSIKEVGEEALEIEDIETLLSVLRTSRIDREKREAVENYLEHAIDLSALQDEMHEIMSIFVFQASRRQLLAHLMRQYDQVVRNLEEDDNHDNKELLQRKEALEAAVKHADEEISKLAFWSDVKKMAGRGELRPSLDGDQSWYESRPGLDRSGPKAPNGGELPGTK